MGSSTGNLSDPVATAPGSDTSQPSDRVMPSKTILVIGAGAAGLAAARDLSRAGCEVIVLEARDRIGGRVFTLGESNSPVPIELGAEFIHGKSPAIWDLARAANLKIQEVSGHYCYFDDGKLSKSRDFWRSVHRLMDKMESIGSDLSLRQFLNSAADDPDMQRAKAMATGYVEGFHAADIDRVGIQGLVKANQAADSIDGDESFRFQDGYDSLMQVLRAESESYGATFHLNTIVTAVYWQGRSGRGNYRISAKATHLCSIRRSNNVAARRASGCAERWRNSVCSRTAGIKAVGNPKAGSRKCNQDQSALSRTVLGGREALGRAG